MVRQGASHMCDGSAHSSGRVVSNAMHAHARGLL